jgi:YD repeat-containing protein
MQLRLRRALSFARQGRTTTRGLNGNITRSLREDGSCWYYAYDGLQRLTAADWKDAGGATLYAFEYEYDKVGNRLRFAQNGVSTYYSYNEANELVSEVTPGSETAYYAYDGRGNQIRRSVLAGHTTYFTYNSRNLVSGIWNTDPTFTPNYFEYNALGQRIKKVDSTGTTRYLWDGLNILLETDASGNLTRRYTHGYSPIEGLSSLIAVEGTMQCPCFYHFDQVGGVRHLTDPYHNTIKSYAYEPFGRLLAESGCAPNEFTFPATYTKLPDIAQIRSSPTRLCEARTGRFLSRDSQARLPDYNTLDGRPTLLVDPSGRVNGGPAMDALIRMLVQLELRSAEQAPNNPTFDPRCPDWVPDAQRAALQGAGRIADAAARACLLSALKSIHIYCRCWNQDDPCGRTTALFGRSITIFYDRNTLQTPAGCPSGPALILHEAAHKCKWIWGEAFAEACENEAFGNRGATPPEEWQEKGGRCAL